jgi:hypothetical protein
LITQTYTLKVSGLTLPNRTTMKWKTWRFFTDFSREDNKMQVKVGVVYEVALLEVYLYFKFSTISKD